MLKIAVLGTGYVGLVTGACLADLGNEVTCIDVDKEKVELLNKGVIPIYEPGLKEVVQRNREKGRLRFTSMPVLDVQDVAFICVGTPQKHNGDADLSSVYEAAKTIAKKMETYTVVVNKSTVPVGTAEKVRRIIRENNKAIEFDVVSNPEFLREGAAIEDFQNPDRIVVGTKSEKARKIMAALYEPLTKNGKTIMFTDEKSSELIKYASNAMLASRISFMNEISGLCEAVGADIEEVARGMGLDTRIGPKFLQAGAGYGGSCFPKDVRALAHSLEKQGLTSNILMAVDYTNERQKKSLVPKLKKFLPELEGKTIAVWGLAFKPRTDDMREAPSLAIIEQLQGEYAKIKAYDPEAMKNAKKILKNVEFTENQYEALKGADALIIATEWDEFRQPDFEKMKSLMKNHVVIDGRNIYSPAEMKKQGFKYASIGR